MIIKTMRFSLFLFSIVLSSFTWSQSTGNLSNEWQLLSEQSGVQIYGSVQPCSMSKDLPLPFDIAFLKIVNTTNEAKQVSYNFVIEYIEGCRGCNDELESFFIQKIQANSTLQEDCNFTQNGMSHIIKNPNFNGGWNFTNARITNLKID
jgi:ribonuclease BN (tRNA processing enzyme)